jgi:hypothetical protein
MECLLSKECQSCYVKTSFKFSSLKACQVRFPRKILAANAKQVSGGGGQPISVSGML